MYISIFLTFGRGPLQKADFYALQLVTILDLYMLFTTEFPLMQLDIAPLVMKGLNNNALKDSQFY